MKSKKIRAEYNNYKTPNNYIIKNTNLQVFSNLSKQYKNYNFEENF